MKKYLLYIICYLYSNVALAYQDNNYECEKSYANKLNRCKVTKRITDDYEPKKFNTSNNLLRKTGEVPCYSGQKIIIKGKVLDKNCIPVQDAKVYLWQVGTDGKYPYIPFRARARGMMNLHNDSTFTGSGTATSNNKGEYYFLTLFPGRIPYASPNVNIRVEHHKLGKLQTKLFLSNKNLSNDCGEINYNLAHIGEIKTYNFDIVLPKKTLKRY